LYIPCKCKTYSTVLDPLHHIIRGLHNAVKWEAWCTIDLHVCGRERHAERERREREEREGGATNI
jgi:hypothetical protein